MKKKLILPFTLILGISSFSEEIIVYGPSSMKWIESSYAPIFKKKYGDDIKFIAIDGIVNRLNLEKKNPKSDVVVGITELDVEKAKSKNLLLPYIPKNINNISNDKFKMNSKYIVPIDYGYLGINYNKDIIKNPPKNLEELSKLNKKLLIQNPNFSVTGQEALQWSIALYGKDWLKFWEQLKPAIYNVEKGWSESFSKFTTNEAPMMLGYTTSNLFFYMEEGNKYDTFLLEEGSFIYQEGASLVNKKDIKDGAKRFLEEILSENFQKIMVDNNYMFPVINIPLKSEFQYVPQLKKGVKLSPEEVEDLAKNIDKYKRELIEFLKK